MKLTKCCAGPAMWRCLSLSFAIVGAACSSDAPTEPDPVEAIITIPVVVHIVHLGELAGEGHNLSEERVAGQVRILNEDFRRLEGTPGFNTHPHSADSRIQFQLAETDPQGNPSSGIHRIMADSAANPTPPNQQFDHYAYYGYWDPDRYINIWTLPLAASTVDVFLGKATGPETDLPGSDLLEPGEPLQAEGILINSAHFGESALNSEYNRGRTLTHEMGHYLGLLHTWGGGDCENNDYCDDTPPVSSPVLGCPPSAPLGCDGTRVLIENYMNYTHDRCMNVFTQDQIARMHYVLENSPRRKTLGVKESAAP